MSLRLRLALTYILFLIPALVAFSAAVYFIASQRFYSALDDELLARVDGVRAAIPASGESSQADIRQAIIPMAAASSVDFAFELLDTNGQPFLVSSRAAVSGLPGPKAFPAGPGTSVTWKSDKRKYRIAYEQFPPADATAQGFIIGAVSQTHTDDALEELRSVFLVGGILVVLLTVGPAYVLAGRSLRPVREISAVAAEIERTGDFNKSLPPPSTRGETAELVDTFNAMIQRMRHMLLAQAEFLAHSSHELRRPLTVLRTNIDVLSHPRLSDRERQASLQAMQEEAESMSKLIADLLLLAREGTQSMQMTEVDLADLCSRLCSRLRERDNSRRVSFHKEGSTLVMGDPDRLEQMVANLLDNAMRYTPAEGSIDLGVLRYNGSVHVRVDDSGPGIPEEEQTHIFERFFRGRKARESYVEGTGLGLVIVKHVAETHGGSVSFHSQPGRGSSFVVELPALPQAEARAGASQN